MSRPGRAGRGRARRRLGHEGLIPRGQVASDPGGVVRRAEELAAIVPMADIELLEALEDEIDLAAAREALADPRNVTPNPWDEVRARLQR